MVFLGLLSFVVKCFDVLAWPFLGLIYPLYTSIKVIESDKGISECRKLVAYWVLLSLILLFEHSFQILLDLLPFWPYMKLTITCWLVIPPFDRAFHVYKHLVCRCLSVDTQFLIMLKNWEDLSSKKCNLEAKVKEKGLEACEELVSSEQASLTDTVKSNLASEEIKEISVKVEEAGGELSEIQVSNQVQKEWTCALCQVTTQSEITLSSHLRGRRHKAACDELKPKKQQSESTEDAAFIFRQRQKKYKLQGVRKKYVEYRKNLLWCKLCNISCSSIDNMDCHLCGKKHLDRTREFNALAADTSKAL